MIDNEQYRNAELEKVGQTEVYPWQHYLVDMEEEKISNNREQAFSREENETTVLQKRRRSHVAC